MAQQATSTSQQVYQTKTAPARGRNGRPGPGGRPGGRGVVESSSGHRGVVFRLRKCAVVIAWTAASPTWAGHSAHACAPCMFAVIAAVGNTVPPRSHQLGGVVLSQAPRCLSHSGPMGPGPPLRPAQQHALGAQITPPKLHRLLLTTHGEAAALGTGQPRDTKRRGAVASASNYVCQAHIRSQTQVRGVVTP